MPIRLAATDLDGTLLDSRARVSARTRYVWGQAAQRGVYLALASGRTRSVMEEVLAQLPALHYLIQSNGAQIVDMSTGEVVHRQLIAREHLPGLLAILERSGVCWHCFSGGSGYTDARFAGRYREFYRRELGADRAERTAPAGLTDLPGRLLRGEMDVEKLGVITGDRALRERLFKTLERLPQFSVTSASWFNIEINDKQATKGRALAWLAGRLGIPASEVAAFGDHLNDVSMLEYAGYGVAMANAFPLVRARARYVTASNDEDGVAAFLAEHLDFTEDTHIK